MAEKLKAYLFAGRDVPADFAQAEEIAKLLRARKVDVRVVDRISAKTEDVLLVAEYGVVEPLVLVVLSGDRLRLRTTRLTDAARVRAALDLLFAK